MGVAVYARSITCCKYSWRNNSYLTLQIAHHQKVKYSDSNSSHTIM